MVDIFQRLFLAFNRWLFTPKAPCSASASAAAGGTAPVFILKACSAYTISRILKKIKLNKQKWLIFHSSDMFMFCDFLGLAATPKGPKKILDFP